MKWYSSTSPMSRGRFSVRVGLATSAVMGVAAGMRACVCVTVVMVGGRLWLADDDQPPVGGAQDLDGEAIEPAEGLPRDHLLDRALDGAAAG